MEEVFSRKWLVATVATWIMIIILDEVAYYYWQRLNPGSQWTGLIAKHSPTTTWEDSGGQSYPNGYRPAGAG